MHDPKIFTRSLTLFRYIITPSWTSHIYSFHNQFFSHFFFSLLHLGPTGSGLVLKFWLWLDYNYCKYTWFKLLYIGRVQRNISSSSWTCCLNGSYRSDNFQHDFNNANKPCSRIFDYLSSIWERAVQSKNFDIPGSQMLILT